MEAVKTPGIPVVRRRIGNLPELWDRSAIFAANLLSLFYGNEAETEVLRETVGTIETYGGRLVPIIDLIFRNGGNLLLLQREPDPDLLGYFSNELRLSLPGIEILPHEAYLSVLEKDRPVSSALHQLVDRLKKHPAEWMDGFVTDPALEEIAARSGKRLITSQEGSRRGNNKYLLHEYLAASGLPVFDSHVAAGPDELAKAVKSLRAAGYRQVVVKAQIGASGIGIHRIGPDDSPGCPEYLFHEGPCLVQGWIEADGKSIEFIGSPSAQMFVGDEDITLYDLTDQILSEESVHEGNVAPPPYLPKWPGLESELLSQAEKAAGWLHGKGYRGTASVDFHLVRRNGSIEARICEINARVTGATYPALLARHFMPNGVWLMRNVRFSRPCTAKVLLTGLDSACLLYRPGRQGGVLPINLNIDADGRVLKGQFLAIGPDLEEVSRHFQCVLNLETFIGEYDRD